MTKKILKNEDGSCSHWCEGCQATHKIFVAGNTKTDNVLCVWNGDYLKPTFSPALRHQTKLNDNIEQLCHYLISLGEIRYYPDSTHQFAGKSQQLLPVPST